MQRGKKEKRVKDVRLDYVTTNNSLSRYIMFWLCFSHVQEFCVVLQPGGCSIEDEEDEDIISISASIKIGGTQ